MTMPGTVPTRLAALVVLACVALSVPACASDEPRSPRPAVTTAVVSDESTKNIWVTEPAGGGPSAVVLAMHGIGGTGEDMRELASHLARGGTVVFAPTYQTDWTTEAGLAQAARDAECGYRFVRTIAAEHGGDLDRPVAFVGWSLGATAVLGLGLTEDIDPSGRIVSCFRNVPRPDVIVAVSGCYYEYQGKPVDADTSAWGNPGVHLVLVAADQDTTCAAWQSKRAAADLRSLGYDVDLVVLHRADHLAPLFLRAVEGGSVIRPDDPPGDRLVRIVLNAIAAADGPV